MKSEEWIKAEIDYASLYTSMKELSIELRLYWQGRFDALNEVLEPD